MLRVGFSFINLFINFGFEFSCRYRVKVLGSFVVSVGAWDKDRFSFIFGIWNDFVVDYWVVNKFVEIILLNRIGY